MTVSYIDSSRGVCARCRCKDVYHRRPRHRLWGTDLRDLRIFLLDMGDCRMRVITLKHPPSVIGYAAVVGGKEHEGPLGADFDLHDPTGTFGMDTWEKSESEMQRLALNLALAKGKKVSLIPLGT